MSSNRARRMSSNRARLDLLLGDRRGAVTALALSSVVAGFAEAAMLAVIAQIAAALVNGSRHVHLTLGGLRLEPSVGRLIGIAFGLAAVRLALQAPISTLPARIGGDVQAKLRRELFGAFTRASWEVQSSDREGHLQETMTSQVIQATSAAVQATTLLTTLITFLILLLSALALNPLAAAIVLVVAIGLFGLLRPLNALGSRRARALSQSQVDYAGGIGEAIRLAEDTQVFGVGAAQRVRIERLVDGAHELFYKTWMLSRLIPNLYQGAIYLLLVGGLAGLYAAGSGHVASLGAVVLLLVRAGNNGQQVQGAYQGLRQSLPFVERLQEAQRRYEQSAPEDGNLALPKVRTARLRARLLRLPARPPGARRRQLRGARRRGGRHRRPLRRRASRRSYSCCCGCARPARGAI